MATVRCNRCGGDGFVDNPEVDGVDDTRLYLTCPVCRGTGETEIPPCRECGGRGLIASESGLHGYSYSDCKSCDGRGY